MRRGTHRFIIGLVTLACGPQTTAAPPPDAPRPESRFAYRPFAARYRAVSRVRIDQEYPPGRVTSTDFTIRVHFAATVDSGSSGLRATVEIDSVPDLDGAGIPLAEAERAVGAQFRGSLLPDGRLTAFEGPERSGMLLEQLGNTLRDFFPRIPANGAAPGEHWVDTTESTSTATGLEITITSMNEHAARAWVDFAGTRALHVVTSSRYLLGGQGAQGGQEITIEGSGARHADYYLGSDGRYLGATATDTSRFQAMIGVTGIVLPITQTRADSLAITP